MKLLNNRNTILSTLGLLLIGQSAYAESGTMFRELLNDPLAWGFAVAVFFLLISLAVLNKALNTVRDVSLKSIKGEEAAETAKTEAAAPSIMNALTDATPIEKEAEILLDHDYDGIHELDNNLPPWWIWGFYASIVYAVIYMAFFITSDKLDTGAEYEREMAAAKEKVEAYMATAANAVDESNVVAMTDNAALSAGAKIFASNCAACHMADGGGMVGPNLTDEYWIHGGGITNVFSTIKYGVPAKGMIAWKEQLSPVQMQQVASYILTLEGTIPASPKAPEGEIWVEPSAEEAAPTEAEETTTEDNQATNETTEDQTTTATTE